MVFGLFLHSQKTAELLEGGAAGVSLVAPWNRKDSVAQLVEQYTFNVWVLGSSPSGITG